MINFMYFGLGILFLSIAFRFVVLPRISNSSTVWNIAASSMEEVKKIKEILKNE